MASLLADMGADVIKVEKLPGGDDARGYAVQPSWPLQTTHRWFPRFPQNSIRPQRSSRASALGTTLSSRPTSPTSDDAGQKARKLKPRLALLVDDGHLQRLQRREIDIAANSGTER